MTRPKFLADRYGPKRLLRFLNKLLQWQREAPLSTPLARRIAMWRGGYRAASYTLYDLSPAHASEYLPDSARLDIFFINGPFARTVLNDKLLFASLLHHHLPIPKTLALIGRGETYELEQSLGEQPSSARPIRGPPKDVLDLAQAYGSVILKPSDGSRGQGIYHLEAHDDLSLNGQAVTPREVQELVKKLDNYLITATVQQAAYARAICAETTNTVRVLTLVDPYTNEPFVACAVHRFGTPETNPTDNWSRGGLLCACDLETGTLGPSVKSPKLTGGALRWSSHHPDTGAPVEGVRVPHWAEVCEVLLAAIRAMPFFVYVGWDVVVTDDGFYVIEGNNNTDIEVQVFGGLLKNPRVRRFYEYHKVI